MNIHALFLTIGSWYYVGHVTFLPIRDCPQSLCKNGTHIDPEWAQDGLLLRFCFFVVLGQDLTYAT
jgi:hypothetical protein